MTKFFLKKDNKNKQPLHSQVVGIVWISIALLFIAALAIFLPHKVETTPENDSIKAESASKLEQKEDSVYRQRRKTHPKAHIFNEKNDILTEKFDTFRPAKRQPLTIELNSADTLTLQLLHGIGPAYARRIVAYRERLGGFRSKAQLLEVYGFTPELLENIAPHLTIDTLALKKIAINSTPLKQLIKHPYIEYYQARDIVRLRNNGQTFSSADDLRAVPSMTDSTLARLMPYLSFD